LSIVSGVGYSLTFLISPMNSDWTTGGGDGGAVMRLSSASVTPVGRWVAAKMPSYRV
jgi:hypothetical protein